MKVKVIIPARYKSTRFPGKPLVNINGVPMIIRVSDIVGKAVGKENVYIATENSKIAKWLEIMVTRLYSHQTLV